MQNDIQLQLEQVKESWDAITTIPEDLTPHGYPGLTKQAITSALGGLCEIASHLVSISDFEPDPLSRCVLLPHLTNIRTYVNTHIPPNPIPHLPGLLTLIDSIQNILRHWLDEANKSGNPQKIVTALATRLANATSEIKNAKVVYEELKESHKKLSEFVTNAEEADSEIAQVKTTVDSLLASAKATSAEIDVTSTSVNINAKKIESLTEAFTNLESELVQNKSDQIALFEEFEKYRQQVSDILGDSNRAGMAGSFIARKTELKHSIQLWERVFVGSLVCLILMAIFLISPSLSAQHWNDLLFRLPLTAPIIWLGWFAAKQYGYNIRLSEDYAYKAASAMAFEGFKRESLSDENKDMRSELLGMAIKNFGENPIRIYDGRGNHGSPAHELFEQITNSSKLMDLFKAIVDKLPGK